MLVHSKPLPGVQCTYMPLCLQIPITVHGAEGRYASALYSAAARAQQIDTVEKDLDQVSNTDASAASEHASLEQTEGCVSA